MKKEHGGDLGDVMRRFGYQSQDILDLSTGISPQSWPVPPALVDTSDWQALPQSQDENLLCAAIRENLSLDDGVAICLAPGSQVLINLVPHLRPKGRVMIPDPAYGEHAPAWQRAGHAVVHYQAGSYPDASEGCVVAVQPGNPMGEVLARDVFHDLVVQVQRHDGLVVVDEAFADLIPEQNLSFLAGIRGLIVLRSFGKFYGLAGLRLGYALGHGDDIDRLQALLGPWAVSTPALKIGAAALADTAFQQAQRQWLLKKNDQLTALLARHGVNRIGGTSLYLLAEVNDAKALQDHLARAAIWTRVFQHQSRWIRFGLPQDEGGFDRLDAALAEWSAATGVEG